MADLIEHEEAEELIALAALGVLEPGASGRLDQHLAECAGCRMTARAFRRTVAILPESLDPVDPPREVRRRIISAVYAAERTHEPRPSLRSMWRRVPANRAFTLIAVAASVAALVLGFWGASRGAGGTTPQTFSVVATTAQPGVHGELVYYADSSRALVTVSGLQPAPSSAAGSDVYELWLLPHSGAPVPAAFLAAAPSSGAWNAVIAGNLASYAMVAATVEPPGGSATPTGSQVFSVALAHA